MFPLFYKMDPFHKHILTRLDNIEAELSELRETTWPVCQGIIDGRTGQFSNIRDKRRFFKFLDRPTIQRLLDLKSIFMATSKDLVYEELRQVLVEEPRVHDV